MVAAAGDGGGSVAAVGSGAVVAAAAGGGGQKKWESGFGGSPVVHPTRKSMHRKTGEIKKRSRLGTSKSENYAEKTVSRPKRVA